MYVVMVFNGTDWEEGSRHTQEVDALAQQQRFIDHGTSVDQIRIVEQ